MAAAGVIRDVTLLGIGGDDADQYPASLDVLARHAERFAPPITDRLGLDDVANALELAQTVSQPTRERVLEAIARLGYTALFCNIEGDSDHAGSRSRCCSGNVSPAWSFSPPSSARPRSMNCCAGAPRSYSSGYARIGATRSPSATQREGKRQPDRILKAHQPAGRLAAERLIELGHRAIIYLTTPADERRADPGDRAVRVQRPRGGRAAGNPRAAETRLLTRTLVGLATRVRA